MSVTWSGPTARALEKVYGCKSPVALFVSRAREILAASKVSGPPFSPKSYADALNILVQEIEGMTLDGTLRKRNDGGFTVCLKKNVSKSRKNFTLAHEIAHTFFYGEIEEFYEKNRGGVDFDQEEERLCDLAAAELLMPFSIFRRDLMDHCKSRGGAITPTVLMEMAYKYEVSMKAVAIRATWAVKNLVCVIWERDRNIAREWITPRHIRQFTPCETGASSIELAFRCPGSVFTRKDSFYIGGRRTTRTTSSLRLGTGKVLSVVHPGWLAKTVQSDVSDRPKGGPSTCRQQDYSRQYSFTWTPQPEAKI